jgi:hypothetical protein
MMLLGFAGLGYAGWRTQRKTATLRGLAHAGCERQAVEFIAENGGQPGVSLRKGAPG